MRALLGDRQAVLSWLGRGNVPAQHSRSSPSHLWHKGLTELYNALCSHRHSAAQAVLQTLVEAHRREIFAPVWFTQHCLWPMFPQQGWSILMPLLRLGSHPNINPNTTKQGQSLTTNFSQHSHRFLKHSSGVGVKVWGRIS